MVQYDFMSETLIKVRPSLNKDTCTIKWKEKQAYPLKVFMEIWWKNIIWAKWCTKGRKEFPIKCVA